MARVTSAAQPYLDARARFGMKFGLETMRALLEALGAPQRARRRRCWSREPTARARSWPYVDRGAPRVRPHGRPLHVASPGAGERADRRERPRDHGRRAGARRRPRATRPRRRLVRRRPHPRAPHPLRGGDGRGVPPLRGPARRRGRARGGPGRTAGRDQRMRAGGLRHRDHRPRPRSAAGVGPRPHRARKGRGPPSGTRDRAGPAAPTRTQRDRKRGPRRGRAPA